MKKLILLLVTLVMSFSSYGLGRTDDSAIQSSLDRATESGFSCSNIWPDGFYLSQVEANDLFVLEIKCENKKGKEIFGKVVYQADGNEGARCRNTTAIAINLNLE